MLEKLTSKEYLKAWKTKNKDHYRQYQRDYYKNHPEKHKRRHLKREYNLSIEEFNKLLIIQSNVCAICQQPETHKEYHSGKIKSLAVDHNHETGKIRGLLCSNCNVAVGLLKDSTLHAQALVDYLKKFE